MCIMGVFFMINLHLLYKYLRVICLLPWLYAGMLHLVHGLFLGPAEEAIFSNRFCPS